MRRQTLDLGRSQAVEGECGEMGHHGPGRVKLGTSRQEETDLRPGSLVNEQAQQLQRGRIDPVEIFHN